jgi:branched-chain amino acid transport system substrate-binding protein
MSGCTKSARIRTTTAFLTCHSERPTRTCGEGAKNLVRVAKDEILRRFAPQNDKCSSIRNSFFWSKRVSVVAIIGLLALAGCALPPLPGGTRPLVKIGLAAPFEGLDRPLGYEALQGVKLALAERNAAGGAGGALVELVALDDSGEAGQARSQAGEFAADPAVMGVVAGWSEETARAALPVYRQEGLGVVVPWSVPAELADGQAGIVLAVADTQRAADALAGAVAADPPRRLVVAGREQDAAPYVAALSARGLAAQTSALPGDAAQAWAVRLTQSRVQPPDALLLTAGGAPSGEALAALRGLGWSGAAYGGVSAGDVQLVEVAGAAADGTTLVSPAPAGRDVPAGGHPDLGPRAVAAYDATQVLLDALDAAGRRDGHITRPGVMATLATVRRQGLTGDIAFDAGGRRVDAPLWLYRIEGASYPGRLR